MRCKSQWIPIIARNKAQHDDDYKHKSNAETDTQPTDAYMHRSALSLPTQYAAQMLVCVSTDKTKRVCSLRGYPRFSTSWLSTRCALSCVADCNGDSLLFRSVFNVSQERAKRINEKLESQQKKISKHMKNATIKIKRNQKAIITSGKLILHSSKFIFKITIAYRINYVKSKFKFNFFMMSLRWL